MLLSYSAQYAWPNISALCYFHCILLLISFLCKMVFFSPAICWPFFQYLLIFLMDHTSETAGNSKLWLDIAWSSSLEASRVRWFSAMLWNIFYIFRLQFFSQLLILALLCRFNLKISINARAQMDFCNRGGTSNFESNMKWAVQVSMIRVYLKPFAYVNMS